jgi:imidazolonepropionase-like amidohydrolase
LATIRSVFLCSILLLDIGLVGAQTPSPLAWCLKVNSKVVALAHVRIIDGTGAPAQDDQTILLSGGKITAIGNAGAVAIPDGAQIMDLLGYSVIPGMVGMHEHMFYHVGWGIFGEMPISFPRLYLAGGVTTIRTAGTFEPYTDLGIKKRVDSGLIPGPKIHVTGPYLEGSGTWSMQMHELTGPQDATETVNFWMDQGVDNFKAYMYITPAELGEAVQAAHKRGAKVTGHLCSIGFREAASLGIDNIEHGFLIDTEFFPWKKPGECPESPKSMSYLAKLDVQTGPVHDMILDLVSHHVAVTSTLAVFEMSLPGRPPIQQRVLDALAPEARNDMLLSKVRAADLASMKPNPGEEPPAFPAVFRKEMEFERAFVQAGGLLLAGVDPTGPGGVLPGFGDQRDVELLVEAGFSPLEAIRIATLNGAQYLGESDRIGSIAPGKQADLVVIKGDPSVRIEDIENVEIVFKDGLGYDAPKLVESVKGLVGIR